MDHLKEKIWHSKQGLALSGHLGHLGHLGH